LVLLGGEIGSGCKQIAAAAAAGAAASNCCCRRSSCRPLLLLGVSGERKEREIMKEREGERESRFRCSSASIQHDDIDIIDVNDKITTYLWHRATIVIIRR